MTGAMGSGGPALLLRVLAGVLAHVAAQSTLPVPIPVDASSGTHWLEHLGDLLSVFAVLLGVIAVAVFDSQFMRAFDRCKDRIMSRLDSWYVQRIEKNAQAAIQVSINTDRLEAFEAAQIEQGRAIKGQLDNHFAQNTLALQGVTVALQAVQREAQATAESVARIEGVLEASGSWDGPNRRTRNRRKPGGAT